MPNCHHSPSHSLVKVLTLRHCFAQSSSMSNGSICRCCCNVKDISEYERGELCSTYNSDLNRFSPTCPVKHQASQFLRWWAPQRGPRRMWWCNSSGTFTTLLSLKAVPRTVPSRWFLLLPVWTSHAHLGKYVNLDPKPLLWNCTKCTMTLCYWNTNMFPLTQQKKENIFNSANLTYRSKQTWKMIGLAFCPANQSWPIRFNLARSLCLKASQWCNITIP